MLRLTLRTEGHFLFLFYAKKKEPSAAASRGKIVVYGKRNQIHVTHIDFYNKLFFSTTHVFMRPSRGYFNYDLSSKLFSPLDIISNLPENNQDEEFNTVQPTYRAAWMSRNQD